MFKNGCYLLFSLAIMAVLCTGCDGKPGLVPVKGQVLIDGEPLPNAMIQVCPADSKAAFGNADADGNFVLTSYDEGDGVVTGTHKVVVVAVEEGDANTQLHHAPLEYGELDTTTATLVVDGPTEDAVIELTWGGKKGPIAVKQQGE